MRLLLATAVALSSLALVPSGLAEGEPAPSQPRAPAAGAAAKALLPTVFGDGLVAGADFSLDLARHAGARIVYFDPSAQWLFHDRTISKVVWGASSVRVV